MPGLGCVQLLLITLLAGLQACTTAVQVAEVAPCVHTEDASGVIALQTDCIWTAPVLSVSKESTRVVATQKPLDEAGTVSIFAGADSSVVSSTTGASPGESDSCLARAQSCTASVTAFRSSRPPTCSMQSGDDTVVVAMFVFLRVGVVCSQICRGVVVPRTCGAGELRIRGPRHHYSLPVANWLTAAGRDWAKFDRCQIGYQ